jgi:hypothetical protein
MSLVKYSKNKENKLNYLFPCLLILLLDHILFIYIFYT